MNSEHDPAIAALFRERQQNVPDDGFVAKTRRSMGDLQRKRALALRMAVTIGALISLVLLFVLGGSAANVLHGTVLALDLFGRAISSPMTWIACGITALTTVLVARISREFP